MALIASLLALSFMVIPSIILIVFFDSTSFWLFLSTFVLVFLLGFQSLTVNSKMYVLAMINSAGIGLCNLYMLKVVPGVDIGNIVHIVSYISGGPLGIISSMFLHFKILPALKSLKNKDKLKEA
jgi:hypothetical protein